MTEELPVELLVARAGRRSVIAAAVIAAGAALAGAFGAAEIANRSAERMSAAEAARADDGRVRDLREQAYLTAVRTLHQFERTQLLLSTSVSEHDGDADVSRRAEAAYEASRRAIAALDELFVVGSSDVQSLATAVYQPLLEAVPDEQDLRHRTWSRDAELAKSLDTRRRTFTNARAALTSRVRDELGLGKGRFGPFSG